VNDYTSDSLTPQTLPQYRLVYSVMHHFLDAQLALQENADESVI
jgi:hypothetical protein